MRAQRGFLLMDMVMGFAILVVAAGVAAQIMTQSRLASQKLQQFRQGIEQQQAGAYEMLSTGKPPANLNGLTIQMVPVAHAPSGFRWISVSSSNSPGISPPLYVLAPMTALPQSSGGGQ